MKGSRRWIAGFLVAGWVLAGGGPARAQAAGGSLTLREAFQRALAANEQVQMAQEGVREAGAGAWKARSLLLPQVSASASYVRQNEVLFNPSSLFSSPGGSTVPSPLAGVFRSTPSEAVQPGEERILQGEARLALIAPEAWFSVGAAGRQADLARARFEEARQEMLLQVGQAFLGTLEAQGLVEVAQAALNRAQEHQRAAQARVAAGTETLTAVLRARTDEARASADLLEAQDQYQIARQVLATLIGLDPSSLPAVLVEPPAPSTDPAPLESLVARALAQRPEFHETRAAVAAAADAQWAARAHLWPTLGLVGTVQHMDPAPAIIGSEDSWRATAVLQVPIFQGGAEYADLSARAAARRRAELALEDLRKRIVLDVERARMDLIRSGKLLLVYQDGARLARQTFDNVSRSFDEGLASGLDLTDARTALASAEQALVRQKYDLRLASLRLARATGTLTVETPGP